MQTYENIIVYVNLYVTPIMIMHSSYIEPMKTFQKMCYCHAACDPMNFAVFGDLILLCLTYPKH